MQILVLRKGSLTEATRRSLNAKQLQQYGIGQTNTRPTNRKTRVPRSLPKRGRR